MGVVRCPRADFVLEHFEPRGGTVDEYTHGVTLSCTERATGLHGPTAFSRRQGMYAALLDFATFSGSLVRIP